ncbi:hypothetical protein ACF08N_24545 [Streptomyces sp. NPDC015127]|uniref:hypothetical protein n=1 Tax=Streptomyces sp. NPDC015127 TaxID=3364939 RepID=UPI0036F50B89
MADGYGALQIHTVEPVDARTAECVVRCVGGTARPGQRYDGGRLRLDRIDRYGRHVDLVHPPHSAKVRLSGDGVARLRLRSVVATHGPRLFGYVGPADIRRAAEDAPAGRVIRTPADFAAWAEAQAPGDLAEPFTYVVDADGLLRLAPRRSEHVACAGRAAVAGAGEVGFRRTDGGRWQAGYVSSQSTGYCPDPDSWPAVAGALDRAGLVRPGGGFTHEVVFRHCGASAELNVVREGDFVCVFCDAGLPQA